MANGFMWHKDILALTRLFIHWIVRLPLLSGRLTDFGVSFVHVNKKGGSSNNAR